MKVSLICGGLGNQIYQYIFARFIEEHYKEQVILDNVWFYKNEQHNGFELDSVFENAKYSLLSDFYTIDEWQYIVNNVRTCCIPYFIQKNFAFVGEGGTDPTLSSIADNQPNLTKIFKQFQYDPNIVKISAPNVYYYGFWQYNDYLNRSKRKSQILKELDFCDIKDLKNQKYLETIKLNNSVGVHIRRGDFVNLGWNKSIEDYKNGLNEMRKKISKQDIKSIFFIFSDDLIWCKNNLYNIGFTKEDDVIFIKGNNVDKNNYIDLQLLSNCRYLLLTKKSTFSQTSRLLNQNLIDYVEV